MVAKCKDCNSVFYFEGKKGSKLSNHKCKCGGNHQRMIYGCVDEMTVFKETNGNLWINLYNTFVPFKPYVN